VTQYKDSVQTYKCVCPRTLTRSTTETQAPTHALVLTALLPVMIPLSTVEPLVRSDPGCLSSTRPGSPGQPPELTEFQPRPRSHPGAQPWCKGSSSPGRDRGHSDSQLPGCLALRSREPSPGTCGSGSPGPVPPGGDAAPDPPPPWPHPHLGKKQGSFVNQLRQHCRKVHESHCT